MKKKVFTPALFDCLKHYSGRQFTKDLVSGVIVAIIALPLSIALALASGVRWQPRSSLSTVIASFQSNMVKSARDKRRGGGSAKPPPLMESRCAAPLA